MPAQIVIDFGTTNTLVAEWSEAQGAPVTVRLPGLSAPPVGDMPPVIPTQVFVEDARRARCRAGQEVKDAGLNVGSDPRFFSGFKRAIAAQFRDPPRQIDGSQVDFERAGELFLGRALAAVRASGRRVDEVLFTVPVQAFEKYLQWIAEVSGRLGNREAHIVDESTAAALGYEVARPGSAILVFDFGGGTLDISVVRTPAGERDAASRRAGAVGQNLRLATPTSRGAR
jgi:molecular chaperone DnaK (HSP70)